MKRKTIELNGECFWFNRYGCEADMDMDMWANSECGSDEAVYKYRTLRDGSIIAMMYHNVDLDQEKWDNYYRDNPVW